MPLLSTSSNVYGIHPMIPVESVRLDLTDGSYESSEEVDWRTPRDPDNPKEWPDRGKWACVVLISLVTFNT